MKLLNPSLYTFEVIYVSFDAKVIRNHTISTHIVTCNMAFHLMFVAQMSHPVTYDMPGIRDKPSQLKIVDITGIVKRASYL